MKTPPIRLNAIFVFLLNNTSSSEIKMNEQCVLWFILNDT